MDHSIFNNIAELLALALALIYALGLLVNSLHLSRFGITPTPLARPQYLFCGIWCLLTALLPPMIISIWYATYSKDYDPLSPSQTMPTGIGAVIAGADGVVSVFGAAISAILIIILIFKISPVTDRDKIARLFAHGSWKFLKAGILALFTGAIALLAVHHYMIGLGAESLQAQIHSLSLAITYLALSLLLAFFFISYFSTSIYPIIPQALGGARPLRIRIFLRSECNPEFRKMIETKNGWDLLLRTGSSYFVKSNEDEENSIEINYDIVQAVVATCPKKNKKLPFPFPYNW